MLKDMYLLFAVLCISACGGEASHDGDSGTDTHRDSAMYDVKLGVDLELAKARAARLSEINYDLEFRIPAEPAAPIIARQLVTFDLSSNDTPLLMDFRESASKLQRLEVNGELAEIHHEAEHLIIPAERLQPGTNTVRINFVAGDTSLNRNPDYVYTLFVPDRARTAFPVFDQPDLKATFDLKLNLPADWAALGNGPLESVTPAPGEGDRRLHTFARSDKLSTYLFSFVAGVFETVTRTVDGRDMTMLHRETDVQKVQRNVEGIFQAHADSLTWLEEYTGIDYPFQKFDFALIPTFQYGGMEHVGAIQYRASTLFLDKDPSDSQRLNRANLIAHETAHMWFGDLVTMEWFNDVWTKEVFANFIAAKMVNPAFPEIDHDLNFLLRSYPAAYAVDRTEGANPIRQNLPNLNEAGTLYGGIIYNKAPIMMKQLEGLLGEDAFRGGIRTYLNRFAGANATWPDLIEILDARTEHDLKTWSDVWVNSAGRPHFLEATSRGADAISLMQQDPSGEGRFWSQSFQTDVFPNGEDTSVSHEMNFITAGEALTIDVSIPSVEWIHNSDGAGYGLFPANLTMVASLWDRLSDLQKGAQLIDHYEQMLEGHEGVPPATYFDFLQTRLDEPNELLLGAILGQLQRTFWSFLSEAERDTLGPPLEEQFWTFITDESLPASTRKIYFRTLQDLAQTDLTLASLDAVRTGNHRLAGISLSARERGNLAALLAVKMPDQADAILASHLATLENPDERRRFEFLLPALSPDQAVRDTFFDGLAEAENRAMESWVLAVLGYLHRPEAHRLAASRQYIPESLELMEEIQVTGDIFFPGRWISQTLTNHRSSEAADAVRTFLAERPDYNYQLSLKIRQAADMLYRAEAAQMESAE